MDQIVIPHPHDEASALIGIQNREILRALGWERGFWTVSDERPAEEALAALGQRGEEWEVAPLRARARWRGKRKATEDAETLARAGSWVYVFGSQFGAKDGELEPTRHFVARFNEALVRVKQGKLRARLEVRRRPFLLHRLVNDALAAAGIRVRGAGSKGHARLVEPALRRGRGRRWGERLREGDAPVNVEGATFLPGGHLVLGLRHPVSEDGHPLLVEVEGIDRYFAGTGDRAPEVVAVRLLENVGSRDAPAGVRELDCLGGDVHVVTGNLDSKVEESALLRGDPGAAAAPNEHWAAPLAVGAEGATALEARRVRRFEDGTVEGIAFAGDVAWYAHDDEEIRLERAGPGGWPASNGAAEPGP